MSDYSQMFFIGFFLLILIVVGGSAIYSLIRMLFAGKLKMKLDKPELARGESIRVDVEVPKNARGLVVGVRAEETYETTGKHGRVFAEAAYEDIRRVSGSVGSTSSIQSFELPKSAPPTIGLYSGDIFSHTRNAGVRWFAFAKADIPNAFDKESKMEFKVK